MYNYHAVVRVACFSVCGVFLNAVNITVPDPHTNVGFDPDGSSGAIPTGAKGQANEDDEVERRGTTGVAAQIGQQWDLESFDLALTYAGPENLVSSAKLGITAGFNFDVGPGLYEVGDIFVYLGSEVPYTVPAGNTYSGSNWPGKDDWDYVIRFKRDSVDVGTGSEDGPDLEVRDKRTSGGTSTGMVDYQVLTKSAVVGATGGLAGNLQYTGEANPLFTGIPLRLLGKDSLPFVTTGTATYTASGSGGTFHNTVGNIDMTAIAQEMQDQDITSAYLHTTFACGNDVMWGGPTVSPKIVAKTPEDGATILMLGAGLVGIGLLRPRRA